MTAIREALQPFAAIDLARSDVPPDFAWMVLRARAALSQEVPQPDDETTWTADYRAGYEAAVAACCALGWKTPQEVPQEPVAWQTRRFLGNSRIIKPFWTEWEMCSTPLPGMPLHAVVDGIKQEWRPLYTTPQGKVAAQEPPPRDPQQEVDLLLGRAAAPSGELPPLPEPIAKVCEGRFNRTRWISSAPLSIQDLPVGPLFTADQMRAYGKAARGEK